VSPLTFLGTNLGLWRILSTPLALLLFFLVEKTKRKKTWFIFYVGYLHVIVCE
jgi:hypothetical protein